MSIYYGNKNHKHARSSCKRFQFIGPPPSSIIINHLTQTSISCLVWFNNNDNDNNNRYIRMQIYIMYIV